MTKRWQLGTLAGLLTLMLVACGGDDSNDTTAGGASSAGGDTSGGAPSQASDNDSAAAEGAAGSGAVSDKVSGDSGDTVGADGVAMGDDSASCNVSDVPFSINMDAVGRDSKIQAVLLNATPAPPARYVNNWQIEFRDMDGNPLSDVQLTKARAWMQAHQHDGRRPVEISAMDAPGQFEVDTINLWMPGLWEVQLTVDSPSAGSDYIVFEVCLEG